jgi:predicted DNA-binding transcriptional regulator AlpA
MPIPTFIRFHDLYERGIAKSWLQLKNLQDKYGFPKGRLIGANTRAWTEEEIAARIESRPTDSVPLKGATRRNTGAA